MIDINFNSIDWKYGDRFSLAKYAGELIAIARITGERYPIVNQHIAWFISKPKMQHAALLKAIGNKATLPAFNGNIAELLPEKWQDEDFFVMTIRTSQIMMAARYKK